MKCKTLYNRNKRNTVTGTDQPEQVTGTQLAGTTGTQPRSGTALAVDPALTLKDIPLGPASLDDYHDPKGKHYTTRTNPELLNWGDMMTADKLKQAGYKATRVPIPGDWDYTGLTQQSP